MELVAMVFGGAATFVLAVLVFAIILRAGVVMFVGGTVLGAFLPTPWGGIRPTPRCGISSRLDDDRGARGDQ